MHALYVVPPFLPAPLMKAALFGGAGVHVFILCSGFGLFLSQLHKPLTYCQFLKRRFIKIYIPYIIVVIISALYYGIIYHQEVLLPFLGSVFLFKMFVPSLEDAFGPQMWFISTIIQFYLCWPLIVKLFNAKYGIFISLIISIGWSFLITLLGLNEERIWNSFFLQYLWEFVLGMWLAKAYFEMPSNLRIPSMRILFPTMVMGLGLTGLTGFVGGIWKSFNDIPSLIGYLSMSLIIYEISAKFIRRFFEFTNKVSYEWYLIHMLAFSVYLQIFGFNMPSYVEYVILIIVAYIVAIGLHKITKTFLLQRPQTTPEHAVTNRQSDSINS